MEYHTGSNNVLLSYKKDYKRLTLENGFLKLANDWYTPDFSFNSISTIQLGEKDVEMWLQITDQIYLILHYKKILEYANSIDGQYVHQLKKTSKLPIIAHSKSSQSTKNIKPQDLEFYYLRIYYLGYKSLTKLKILSNRTSEVA